MASESPSLSITPLGPQDLPAALALQAQAYPPFLVEDEAAFLSRIALPASYCLGARQGNRLLGYLLAHGWSHGSPPPLGSVLADDGPGEVLFIHDLAVSPEQRGLKVGQRLVARAAELAVRDGLRRAELIAVEGAAEYWRTLGFAEETVSGELGEKLATYGSRARWMTREIP
jgi:GNAT superfamily N-acetyltransferase